MTAINFDSALRAEVHGNLQAHPLREHPDDGRARASVAVVLLDSDAERDGRDDGVAGRLTDLSELPGNVADTLTGRIDGTAGGAAFLLTRRGGSLRKHARQWAFPGGRVDPGETLLDAALRELDEEVGLRLQRDDLLGRLDDYPTRSGFVISPFVFWAAGDPELVPNPAEVASAHRVSLSELQRSDSPRFVEIPESDRPVIQVPVGGDLIHAPTGAIMHQLRRVALEGLTERVDEYEQPVFAWR